MAKLTEAKLKQIIRQQIKEMSTMGGEVDVQSKVDKALNARAVERLPFFRFAREIGVSPEELFDVLMEEEYAYWAPIFIEVDDAGDQAV